MSLALQKFWIKLSNSSLVHSFLKKKLSRAHPPYRFNHLQKLQGINSCLVVMPGEIRKTLLLWNSFMLLRDLFPQARLLGLSSQESEPFLTPLPTYFDTVYYLNSETTLFSQHYHQLLNQIQNQAPQVCILLCDPQELLKYDLALQSRTQIYIAFQEENANFPFINLQLKLSSQRPYCQRFTALLKTLRLDPINRPEGVIPSSHPQQKYSSRNKSNQQIWIGLQWASGLNHFLASRGNLIELSKRLFEISEKIGFKIFCPLSEPFSVADWPLQFSSRIIPIKETLPQQLKKELQTCQILISNSSNLFYFAINLQIPVIGLFSSAESQDWSPDKNLQTRIIVSENSGLFKPETIVGIIREILPDIC